MIPGLVIRSSWVVDSIGRVWLLGAAHTPRDDYRDGYHCSTCHETGHSRRTCGREPVR